MRISFRTIMTTSAAVLSLSMISACGPQEQTSYLDGSFKTTKVELSYRYFAGLGESEIERYIVKHNPGRSDSVSNAELASLIDLVASCFEIDERIFASLIRKESTFNMNAVSSTGATGLTQMTKSGIDEVNEQLGMRGTSYALSSATKYFNNTISECVSGYLSEPWVQLWDRGTTLTAQKSVISSDALTALVYGSVLLKTNLSVEKTNNPNASMETLYRNALRAYNGDPAEKENYQKNIMNSAQNDF